MACFLIAREPLQSPLEHSTMTVLSGYEQFKLLNEIHFFVIYTICLVFSIWRIERRKEEELGYWVSLGFFISRNREPTQTSLHKELGQAGVIKRVQGHLANQILDFRFWNVISSFSPSLSLAFQSLLYLLLPKHLLLSNFYRLDSSGRLQ